MNIANLTGQSQDHLTPLNSKEGSPLIHKLIKEDFLQLYDRCKQEGIDLKIVSSFRSFERQLAIWNAKTDGSREVYDKDNILVDISKLSDIEKVHTIMRWSALPGTSRHHWGTDIDVIDESARQRDYQVQLIPSEYNEGGVFSKLSLLLSNLMNQGLCFNFYRPYQTERNGVSQELWHISYLPLAAKFKIEFSYEVFVNFLEQQDSKKFSLLNTVKDNSKEIYEKYIVNTD